MTVGVRQLREDLLTGQWRRLDDPLLVFLLLDDATVWGPVVAACSERLAIDALSLPEAPPPWELLRSWSKVAVARFHTPEEEQRRERRFARRPPLDVAIHFVLWQLPTEEHPGPALDLARRAVALCSREDMRAALRVLDQWSVPEPPCEPDDEET